MSDGEFLLETPSIQPELSIVHCLQGKRVPQKEKLMIPTSKRLTSAVRRVSDLNHYGDIRPAFEFIINLN